MSVDTLRLVLFFNVGGKPLLVRQLDVTPASLEIRVVGKFAKGIQLLEVRYPAVTELLADQVRQRRIAGGEPASLCDAIGLVVEAIGPELGEIPEQALTQQASNAAPPRR